MSGFPIVGLSETIGKPLEMASLLVFELPSKGFSQQLCPRSLSALMVPITLLYTRGERLAIYMANRTCECIALLL